jgi:hypothetical protein
LKITRSNVSITPEMDKLCRSRKLFMAASDSHRGGLPARQVGDPVSVSQIRTIAGQLPLVAAAGRVMNAQTGSLLLSRSPSPRHRPAVLAAVGSRISAPAAGQSSPPLAEP